MPSDCLRIPPCNIQDIPHTHSPQTIGKCWTCKFPHIAATLHLKMIMWGEVDMLFFRENCHIYLTNDCRYHPRVLRPAAHSPLSEFIVKYCIIVSSIVSCIVHCFFLLRAPLVWLTNTRRGKLHFSDSLSSPANTIYQWHNCRELV